MISMSDLIEIAGRRSHNNPLFTKIEADIDLPFGLVDFILDLIQDEFDEGAGYGSYDSRTVTHLREVASRCYHSRKEYEQDMRDKELIESMKLIACLNGIDTSRIDIKVRR